MSQDAVGGKKTGNCKTETNIVLWLCDEENGILEQSLRLKISVGEEVNGNEQ